MGLWSCGAVGARWRGQAVGGQRLLRAAALLRRALKTNNPRWPRPRLPSPAPPTQASRQQVFEADQVAKRYWEVRRCALCAGQGRAWVGRGGGESGRHPGAALQPPTGRLLPPLNPSCLHLASPHRCVCTTPQLRDRAKELESQAKALAGEAAAEARSAQKKRVTVGGARVAEALLGCLGMLSSIEQRPGARRRRRRAAAPGVAPTAV